MPQPDVSPVETREFELPIRLTIGDREIEVPITVTVTFDELTRMVERNLGEGEELYTQLMEHYADQAGRKKGRKSNGESRTSGRTRPTEAPATPPAESNGNGGGKPRKKPAPAPPAASGAFSEEELSAWRGKLPPPFTGRGKKSRDRQLWEAANPDQTAGTE